MTSPIITVDPDATVEEIADTLLGRSISAVPVVDAEGGLYGVVSEADLMHRPELGTEPRGRWWLEMWREDADLARDYARARGSRARDVMRGAVVDVAPDATMPEILEAMDRGGVRRVLVLDERRLVGIVTRADLLRGLVAERRNSATRSAADLGIRSMLIDELAGAMWRTLPDEGIAVRDGVVTFSGEVGSLQERQALRAAAESIPGVTGVEDRTTVPPTGEDGP